MTKAKHTNFIVFGLTQPALKPMIYGTRGDHTNHCFTEVAAIIQVQVKKRIYYTEINFET
jgi:hypothetical protein